MVRDRERYQILHPAPTEKTPGSHSSLPTPDVPIYRLAESLVRISWCELQARLSEATRGYFTRTSEMENGQTAADMKAMLRATPDPDALKRLSAFPFYNAVLRTTAVAIILEGEHAENALPQRARDRGIE